MRTIILMRHAKSSWQDDSIADFDRPLNDRGRKAAPMMASYLASQDWIPNRIASSPSARTRETLALMTGVWKHPIETTWIDELYLAPAITIAKTMMGSMDEGITLLLGHNPGMEVLCSQLAGDATGMPTAALGVFRWKGIEKPTDLREIQPENFELLKFVTPRMLQD